MYAFRSGGFSGWKRKGGRVGSKELNEDGTWLAMRPLVILGHSMRMCALVSGSVSSVGLFGKNLSPMGGIVLAQSDLSVYVLSCLFVNVGVEEVAAAVASLSKFLCPLRHSGFVVALASYDFAPRLEISFG